MQSIIVLIPGGKKLAIGNFFLSGAAGSASRGKTVAWFAFCLELVLVAYRFCKGIYRMLCSHVRFVQIMTKPIHCSELAGDNK